MRRFYASIMHLMILPDKDIRGNLFALFTLRFGGDRVEMVFDLHPAMRSEHYPPAALNLVWFRCLKLSKN